MQKYGLFPNPDVPLQYKDWGAARTVEKGGEGVPAPRVPPEPLEARRLAQPVRFARGAGSRKGLRRTGWGARGQGWRLLLRQRSGSLGRARRSLVASLPPCSCPLLSAPSFFGRRAHAAGLWHLHHQRAGHHHDCAHPRTDGQRGGRLWPAGDRPPAESGVGEGREVAGCMVGRRVGRQATADAVHRSCSRTHAGEG
jgi:hypothetical protein